MHSFRISRALLVSVLFAMMLAGQSLASTHVWVVMDPPSSQPSPRSTFTTDLKISSWNGVAGALELIVRYDPAVLNLAAFTPSPDSPFYPDCFADTNSYTSGETRIACFQVTDSEAWETPISFGTLTWKVVGRAGSKTQMTIEPITVVDTYWHPVEILAYGQDITIKRPKK